jgi:hypothetical protein
MIKTYSLSIVCQLASTKCASRDPEIEQDEWQATSILHGTLFLLFCFPRLLVLGTLRGTLRGRIDFPQSLTRLSACDNIGYRVPLIELIIQFQKASTSCGYNVHQFLTNDSLVILGSMHIPLLDGFLGFEVGLVANMVVRSTTAAQYHVAMRWYDVLFNFGIPFGTITYAYGRLFLGWTWECWLDLDRDDSADHVNSRCKLSVQESTPVCPSLWDRAYTNCWIHNVLCIAIASKDSSDIGNIMVLGLVFRSPISAGKHVGNLAIDHSRDSRRSSAALEGIPALEHAPALEYVPTLEQVSAFEYVSALERVSALEQVSTLENIGHECGLVHAHTLEEVAVALEEVTDLHDAGQKGSRVTTLEYITTIEHFPQQ